MCYLRIFLYQGSDCRETNLRQHPDVFQPALAEDGKFFIGISKINDEVHFYLRFTFGEAEMSTNNIDNNANN